MLPPITSLLQSIGQPLKQDEIIVPTCMIRKKPRSFVPKKKFTADEDNMLRYLVSVLGQNWSAIAEHMPFRNVRQCRDRWNNYINPRIQLRPFSLEEDLLLEKLYNTIGAKWSQIAKHFVGRSDNAVRNRWKYLAKQHLRISAFSSAHQSE